MKTNFHIDSDIRKAHTLDSKFYICEEVHNECKEKIFAKSWHYVGSKELMKENNVIPFSLLPNFLDEPLLLIKNEENGEITCCSNVCTHRANLIINMPCNASHLRCKYHGRRFDLDGKMTFMPEFEEAHNFPSPEDHLPQLPIFSIGELLFVALEKKDTAPFFGNMLSRINYLPIEKLNYRPDLSKTYSVNAHWALYVENYLEGFHIPFVHSGLNTVVDYGSYTTEIYEFSNLQLGLGKNTDNCFEIPAGHQDEGKNVVAYYFWVFPNMMFNFYPWGLSLNIVEPTSQSSCNVRFEVFVWDESKLSKGAGNNLNQVELEDEAIVEQVQKGVRSRFYTKGRFSPTREQGPHHFHRLLVRFLG